MELLQIGLNEGRRAVRTLWRTPAFTWCVLALLTITIGAITSLGTAANELLNGRLPYGRADELVMVWSDLPKSGYSRAPLSGPEVLDLRARSQTLADLAAIAASTSTLENSQAPLQIAIGTVTHNFFSVLQASPQLGRAFTANDEGSGKPPTVILSWSLWQNSFGNDPSIVGRKIRLGGTETEVIGVMPADFRMAFAPDANIPAKTEAWVPFGSNLSESNRLRYFLRVIGRLREPATAEAASREVAGIGASLEREFVGYGSSGRRMFVIGLGRDLAQPVKVPAFALLFASVFLVLLGFGNISGLWVARIIRRRQEQAIHQMVGATATRVRIQMILQAVILSIVGCALGLSVGVLGLDLLRHIRPPSLARIDHASLTWPVILDVVGLVVMSTLFLAVVTWVSITPAASDLTRSRVASAPRYRLRAALIVAQIGLAFVFLVCSALWTRTFLNVLRTDPGFQPEQAFTFRYSVNPLELKDDAEMGLINRRLNDALSTIPGVLAAGSISHLPFDHLPNWSMSYWPEGAAKGATREADVRPVSPGLLKAIGARLHAGRFIEETDDLNTPRVIVVDRLLADRTWPAEDPIGKKLIVATWPGIPPITFTVVGVLNHIRYRTLESQVREQLYVPVRQYPYGPSAFIVRSSIDFGALATAVRERVREVNPRVPIWDLRPLKEYYDDTAAERSFTALLLTSFAIAALMLASIGVYGLLTYIVEGRQGEFGIRLALGASSRQIVSSVLRESLVWAAAGTLISGALFFPIVTRLSSALYGVTPHDPLSWIAAAVALFAVVIIASWIPAYRAGQTDPATLMRNQ